MKLTRKKFLSLLGACLAAVPGRKLLAALDTAARKATAAGEVRSRAHWGMLVDTRKCLAARDCTKCIEACRAAKVKLAIGRGGELMRKRSSRFNAAERTITGGRYRHRRARQL